jgi:hypothetical protein
MNAVGATIEPGLPFCIQSPAAESQDGVSQRLNHQTAMNAERGDPDWPPLQPIIVKRHDALADTSSSNRWPECRINSVSELEAQADSRIDRGSLKEAVCETIGYF